jgi:hypothetical protein
MPESESLSRGDLQGSVEWTFAAGLRGKVGETTNAVPEDGVRSIAIGS